MLSSKIHVTMPDGSVWSVSTAPVIQDYVEYYSACRGENRDEVLAEIEENDDAILDWAANNMDWDDVKEGAVLVSSGSDVDFQEGWVNGEKEVIRD